MAAERVRGYRLTETGIAEEELAGVFDLRRHLPEMCSPSDRRGSDPATMVGPTHWAGGSTRPPERWATRSTGSRSLPTSSLSSSPGVDLRCGPPPSPRASSLPAPRSSPQVPRGDPRRSGKTQSASRAEAAAYLAKSDEVLRSAQDALELHNHSAVTGKAVHAGITAADAIPATGAGTNWRGPHDQAPLHLERTSADGKEAVATSAAKSATTTEQMPVLGARHCSELREHLHLIEDGLMVDDLAGIDLEVIHEPQVQRSARRRDGSTWRLEVAQMSAPEVAENHNLAS